jgi:eukaryotic-like serine/threonine-protein kinase
MGPSWSPPARQIVGRYAICDEIASGGMASVHIGRLLGTAGFARTVAIKRLHPQLAGDPEFVAMLLDEARLIARIHHPNVIPVLDVVALQKEALLVMDYVHGESLAALCSIARKSGTRLPPRFAVAILAGSLYGLHAAHEATNDQGEPLNIVHRDFSPHNILVGADGVARVFDFGIAHAAQRVQVTRDGQIKGTLPYMSPEQLNGASVDRRSDVFSAGAVLWEALTGQRRFVGDNAAAVMMQILEATERAPSTLVPGLPAALDAITRRALRNSPEARFATARDMAKALEKIFPPPTPSELGEWVKSMAGPALERRAAAVHEIESDPELVAAAGEVGDQAGDKEVATQSLLGNVTARFDRASEPTSPTPALARTGRSVRIAVGGIVVAVLIVGTLIAVRSRSPDSHHETSAVGGEPERSAQVASGPALAPSPAPSETPPRADAAEPTVAEAPSATGSDNPPAHKPPLSATMGASVGNHSATATPEDAGKPDVGATPDDCASSPFTYATVEGKLIKRPRPECFPH